MLTRDPTLHVQMKTKEPYSSSEHCRFDKDIKVVESLVLMSCLIQDKA